MSEALSVLYSDRHLIAVMKPARLSTASDASGDDTLLQRVRSWNVARQAVGSKGYCVPIHFLDRPVSGVIVFALSSKAASRLNEQFRLRTLTKSYLAIVVGCPAQPRGTLVQYLAKDKQRNVTQVVPAGTVGAKQSRLTYEVLRTRAGISCLLVQPETGRSHQIRVQLAHMGTPIWGDLKYGATIPWDGKIALHAVRLKLQHPVSREPLSLEARPPACWRELWGEDLPILP